MCRYLLVVFPLASVQHAFTRLGLSMVFVHMITFRLQPVTESLLPAGCPGSGRLSGIALPGIVLADLAGTV